MPPSRTAVSSYRNPYRKVDARYRRQIVIGPTGEAPGTIVVHLRSALDLVQPGGRVRYGVGIGRDGFRWSGRANVGGKKWRHGRLFRMISASRNWKMARGRPGGLDNPLARALYIYKDGHDTGYRIHGSPSGGRSARRCRQAGCVRMINQT
jgi:lipoprotein-anchoring transpeptidase ErfK/SrfK